MRVYVRTLLYALGLALVVLSSACPDEPNSLEGSMDELFDLSFKEVRIRQYQSSVVSMQVEYMRPSEDGSAMDIVAQLTFTEPEGGFPSDVDITFDQVDGRVHRIAVGDDFPDIQEGHLTLYQGGNDVDQRTSGEFSAIFENRRTLRGTFDAKMSLASPD